MKIRNLAALVILSLLVRSAVGQAACSKTTPCVQVPIINSNTIPTQTVFWSCMGDSTSCSAAALQTVIASQTPANLCPSVQSVWRCSSFPQTQSTQAYNDAEPWGALMNYAVQGVTGGGVSAASPIAIFQVPQAPPQIPTLGGFTIVASGSTGPQ